MTPIHCILYLRIVFKSRWV